MITKRNGYIHAINGMNLTVTYTEREWQMFKRIDNKFSIDTNDCRIVKTSNGMPIPDDEPKFILRGRDRLAIPLLIIYKVLCGVDECTPYQMGILEQTLNDFALFRKHNSDKMKQPGITQGL